MTAARGKTVALKHPESMDECIYFTRRADGAGKTMCWVFKEKCPKCGKALMGKPVDDKTGSVKIRAKEYVCPNCKHTEEKVAYEEKLTANIAYTCPKCKHNGEIQILYKRKTVDGVKALVYNCQKCGEKLLVTKKMKVPKKKGAAEDEAPDDDE